MYGYAIVKLVFSNGVFQRGVDVAVWFESDDPARCANTMGGQNREPTDIGTNVQKIVAFC